VLVDGTCQIPDPWYKLIGSIVCFYIPLLVMLLTYTLTVRLLARQRQSLGGSGSKVTTGGWSGWMGAAAPLGKLISNLYSIISFALFFCFCTCQIFLRIIF
jgi:hypothetical protein